MLSVGRLLLFRGFNFQLSTITTGRRRAEDCSPYLSTSPRQLLNLLPLVHVELHECIIMIAAVETLEDRPAAPD